MSDDSLETPETLAQSIKAAQKAAMKAQDKDRLSTLRLILSEFKRIEVDERIAVDDTRALAVLDKMVKQRRDSASQFANAGRQELADKENAEIDVIQEFLPTPLTDAELNAMIDAAIAASGTTGMGAMGAVMNQLKPQVQGRADVAAVSKLVKQRLTS
jgi:hypothetical protein